MENRDETPPPPKEETKVKPPYKYNYLFKQVYSRRKGAPVRKTWNPDKIEEEELDKQMRDFVAQIKADNEAYAQEKKAGTRKATAYKEAEHTSINEVVKQLDDNTGNSCIFIASSKSGKTYCMKQLVAEMLKENPLLIPIFFLANYRAPIYDDIRQKYPVFEHFLPSLVETCYTINKHLPEGVKPYQWLFVCDDMLNLRSSETIRNLCLSYRNSYLSCVMCLQACTLLTRNSRGNATCYLFGKSKPEESESIMRKFLKGIDPFNNIQKLDEKVKHYRDLTDGYNFLTYLPNQSEEEVKILKAT